MRHLRLVLKQVLLAGMLLGTAVYGSEPWADADQVQAAQVAKDLKNPLIIHVGFPVLYRATHITGSIYAGPGSKDEGLTDLKRAVAGQPRSREIILYCGCCPWDKCPNIRPAFAELHKLGYPNVKVMVVPANFKTDWIDKGYPTDIRADKRAENDQ
jgi:thiosulfate/3-mercaptopyruvate sulfurtransferase